MSELSPEGRAMFQRARNNFEPTTSERERNERALAMRLGIGAGALAGTMGTASANTAAQAVSGAGKSLVLVAGKWMAVGLLLGASLCAGVVSLTGVAAPTISTPTAASAPRKPKAAPAAPLNGTDAMLEARSPPPLTLPATSRESATPTAVSNDTRRPEIAPPLTPPGDVREEARLLRSAKEALRAGLYERALVLFDEHAREFPNGVLAQERSAGRVSALCKLGRVQAAREEVARFLLATPGSSLANGMKESCGASLGN